MQSKKRKAIILTVLALILCVLQAGIWVNSTSHTASQTDEANKENQHPPTEIPGVAGFCLLVAAGILASTPDPRLSE
jgi:flagellar basal body-associated protein FliL